MVKQRMDLLELLRKRGMDGDVDLLREALRVLVDGIMDAEVSADRRPARRTQPRAGHLPQPHLGYPRRHHGVAHSQAAGRQLLPQPAGTTAAQRESPAVKGGEKTVTVQTCGDLRAIRPRTEGQPSTEFALQADSSPQT